jgi:uncharacterized membrane protein
MTLLVLELRVPDLRNSVNATELPGKIGEDAALFSFMIWFLCAGVHFINPEAGFYAMAVVLLGLRLWQTIGHSHQVTKPS